MQNFFHGLAVLLGAADEDQRDVFFAGSIGFELLNLEFSPVKWPEGNIEYLLHLKKRPEGTICESALEVSPEAVVQEAHGQLD